MDLPPRHEMGSSTQRALVAAINRAKPSGAKGTFIKKVSLSSTMGPGIKLDPATAIT